MEGRNVAVAYKNYSLLSHGILNAPSQEDVITNLVATTQNEANCNTATGDPIDLFGCLEFYDILNDPGQMDTLNNDTLNATDAAAYVLMLDEAEQCMLNYNFFAHINLTNGAFQHPDYNYRHNVYNSGTWSNSGNSPGIFYEILNFLDGESTPSTGSSPNTPFLDGN